MAGGQAESISLGGVQPPAPRPPAFTWKHWEKQEPRAEQLREEKHMPDNSAAGRGDAPGWGQSAQDGHAWGEGSQSIGGDGGRG